MYKILVVDDEPKIREVIKEYGEFSGYEITEADDGITAVGLCKLNDYDHDAEAGWVFRLQRDKKNQRHSGHYALGPGRRVR